LIVLWSRPNWRTHHPTNRITDAKCSGNKKRRFPGSGSLQINSIHGNQVPLRTNPQADRNAEGRGRQGPPPRIRETIEHYGLTASDLGLAVKAKPGPKAGGAPKRRKRKGGGAAKAAAVVKYSNGAGGTWGGRGKRPQWLRDAINSGKQLSDFLVK
jgi:DNA-binding protein H-NS